MSNEKVPSCMKHVIFTEKRYVTKYLEKILYDSRIEKQCSR